MTYYSAGRFESTNPIRASPSPTKLYQTKVGLGLDNHHNPTQNEELAITSKITASKKSLVEYLEISTHKGVAAV